MNAHEQAMDAIAKTVGATEDGADVVAAVERLVERNIELSRRIGCLESDLRSGRDAIENMATINEALGEHFATVNYHNPYTEERVEMLVKAYEALMDGVKAAGAELAKALVRANTDADEEGNGA